MEFSSVGKKIKKLRRDLGLRQDALTNNEITRSLISMVENNKRTLTYHSAQVIAESLNKYYENLGKTITAEYLLETEEDQARNYIYGQLKDLEENLQASKVYSLMDIENIFNRLLEISKEWNLKREQAEVQLLRGKVHFKNKHYYEALSDFSIALLYFTQQMEYNSAVDIEYHKGQCYQELGLYEEASIHYYISYLLMVEHRIDDNELKQRLLLSTVKCYIKLKKYEMALQYVILFKDLYSYIDEYYDQVLLQEANCYRAIGNFKKAEDLYQGLIKRSANLSIDLLIEVYRNYSILFKFHHNPIKSLEYFDMALKEAKDYHVELHYQLILEKSQLYIENNHINEAIELLENSTISVNTSICILMDIYLKLSHLYIQRGDYKQAENYLKRCEAFILEGKYQDRRKQYYSLYAELYACIGEREMTVEYIRKLREAINN
ncbi:helix-turn-helix domain-containing protein [Alkaliphilus serpentinus]|uniref:Helix-turn-helix transcriptional regulator n=1 Tax=Alkaliphilus serpentinus TaxID=1482731 RepID=A0A833HPH5_9FIRM|nr:tetratricopeptide repeat protein [Alkaliphilus serpentinus]KAB3530739.1 helix-turn-helix transcriptional regulator [Alkaliphilus serpentinus]